jgi:chromate transporter
MMAPEPVAEKNKVPLLALMGVFLRVGLSSFGGSTAAWLYREIVQNRGWLGEEGFLTALTFSQVLPGANPVNMSIYVGSMLRGGLGGTLAAIGIVAPAFCVILTMGILYAQFGASALGHAVLGGLAAAGAGVTLSIGAKLAGKVRKPLPVIIALAIFAAVGLAHWPMIPVVLALTPLSIGLEFYGEWRRTKL